MSVLKRNLTHYFSYSVVNLLVGVLAVPVLTRLLSPAEYGAMAVALSLVSTLQTCCFQWLQVSVSRFYRTSLLGSHQFAMSNVWPMLAISALVSEALYASSIATGFVSLQLNVVVVTGVALLTQGTFAILMERLYIQQRAKQYQTIGNAFTIGRNVLGIVLAAAVMRTAWAVLLGLVAVQGLLIMLMARGLTVEDRNWRWPDAAMLKRATLYSGPITVANILGTSLTWFPLYLLNHSRGPAEAGLFQLVVTLAGLLVSFIPSVILFEAYPRIQMAHAKGESKLISRTLATNMLLTVAMGSCAVIVSCFAGAWILRTVAGPHYQLSNVGVSLAALGALFQAAGRSLDPIYKLQLRGWRLAIIFFTAASAGAVVCAVAVPRAGALGACLGMAVGHFVALCWFGYDTNEFVRRFASPAAGQRKSDVECDDCAPV